MACFSSCTNSNLQTSQGCVSVSSAPALSTEKHCYSPADHVAHRMCWFWITSAGLILNCCHFWWHCHLWVTTVDSQQCKCQWSWWWTSPGCSPEMDPGHPGGFQKWDFPSFATTVAVANLWGILCSIRWVPLEALFVWGRWWQHNPGLTGSLDEATPFCWIEASYMDASCTVPGGQIGVPKLFYILAQMWYNG